MISWNPSMNYRWRGSGLWGKFRRRWGREGASFVFWRTNFRKIGLIRRMRAEGRIISTGKKRKKVNFYQWRAFHSTLDYVKCRKILSRCWIVCSNFRFVETKLSFPFFLRCITTIFDWKKKGEESGKRRKLVFPVPFQSYKKTFVINK